MDKLAALRSYDGKRMRVDAAVGYGAKVTFEGVVTIRVVGGKERIYIHCDDGLEI